jgi:hypothetical protein
VPFWLRAIDMNCERCFYYQYYYCCCLIFSSSSMGDDVVMYFGMQYCGLCEFGFWVTVGHISREGITSLTPKTHTHTHTRTHTHNTLTQHTHTHKQFGFKDGARRRLFLSPLVAGNDLRHVLLHRGALVPEYSTRCRHQQFDPPESAASTSIRRRESADRHELCRLLQGGRHARRYCGRGGLGGEVFICV